MLSDWLRLEYKSHNTFDIIVSTKSVFFFKFLFRGGLQPEALAPPPHSRCACLAYFVLVCNGIQDKDKDSQFLQNIDIFQTTCCHIPVDYCNLQLLEPQVLHQIFALYGTLLTLITNCQAEYLNWSGRKSHDEEKSHTEDLRNLYSFPSVFQLIKSRNMVWAGPVLFLLGQLKNAY